MLTIRVLGVGDADCIVIQFPDGRFALVDCSVPQGQTQPPALSYLRDAELAFCCLTHPHDDHFTGMRRVLSDPRVRSKAFWYALSDLDVVLESYNWVRSSTGRSAAEATELFQLFNWVNAQPGDYMVPILREQYFNLGGGVEVVAFGPRPSDWQRYRRALAKRRADGAPINRQTANAISIALLVKYAGHAVWLLSDLTAPSLRKLSTRAHQSGIMAARQTRASIVKISHHGALDGWFQGIAESLTRCAPEDTLIVSAGGTLHHPHPDVRAYWLNTGKRLVATYSADPQPKPPIGGSAAIAVEAVARPLRTYVPQDVTVAISPDGHLAVSTSLRH
jgi:hypothetical protein